MNGNYKMAKKGRQNGGQNNLVQRFDDHEDIKTGIRELLLRLEPLVKVSGGNAPISSMMGYLEEVDDASFDKYLLVRHIKSKLQSSLQDLVQAEVQLQCRDTQLTPEKMKIVAPAILSKLMTSPEMEECLSGLQEEVGDSALDMCTNFDRELVLMSQLRESYIQRPPSRSSSSLSDSLSSTWNQSGFVFIQPNQYAKIGDKLNPYRGSEDRIEALNTLNLSQIGECISVSAWPVIKEGLQACLLDNNGAISGLALRLYAKMLANVSPFCTKEAFCSMVNTIVGLYKDRTRNYQLPTMTTELSFKKRCNNNLLQIIRLVTSTCHDLPKFWSRYPPSMVEMIMKAMLELSTLKSKGQKSLSPIHLISLVDPKAKWLKAWLHGNLGKQMFFPLSQDTANDLFFKTACHHLLASLEKDNFPLLSRTSGRKKGLISNSLMSFAFLNHNLNVVCLALQCHQGRLMFPINLPGRVQPLDELSLVKILVGFVCNSRNPSQYNLSKVIVQTLIKNVCSSDANIRRFWLNTDIMEMLVGSLSHAQHPGKALMISQILSSILNSPSGMFYAQNVILDDYNMSITDFVLDICSNLLTNLQSHYNDQLIGTILIICQQICKNHLTVVTPKFDLFIEKLKDAIMDIEELASTTPTNSMANINFESNALELKEKLFAVLNAVSITPYGLEIILKHKDLASILISDKCIELDSILTIPNNDHEILSEIIEDLESLPDLVMTFSNPNFDLALLENWMPIETNLEHDFDNETRLHLILSLMSNLRLRCFILSKYDLTLMLENYLDHFKMEDGILSQDNISLNIQYILESLKGIGGPSERKSLRNEESNEVMEKFSDPPEIIQLLKHEEIDRNWTKRVQEIYENSNLSITTLANILNKLWESKPITDDGPQDIPNDMINEAAKIFGSYALKQNCDLDIQLFTQNQDWLSMILVILFHGNLNKVKNLRQRMNFRHLNLNKIGHFVEMILLEEEPNIARKFKANKISVSWMVNSWLEQWFLNTLDFDQIINFFVILSMYSLDYAIYSCVCILKSLEQKISVIDNADQLFLVMKCDPIYNFNFHQHLNKMHTLCQKYQKYVLKYM